MDYLIKHDLYQLITEPHLNDLTGIAQQGMILAEAEAIAVEEMSNYLSVRYDIDQIFVVGTKPQSLIALYLIDIMLYHLYSRITPQNVPEVRKERYQHAKDWLEKVADGFINPNLPAKTDQTATTGLPLYGNLRGKRSHHF